jgi:uncharacterized membrane protein YdjX (TVP38/TMEM64 family)
MSEPVIPDDAPAPPRGRATLLIRFSLVLALIALAAVAAYMLFRTPLGDQLRDRRVVDAWVRGHRMVAPLILVGLYVLMSVLMLPVWWLQVLAGYSFGLVWGVLWCQLAAGTGAVLSLVLSRWLVGEWFRQRYESRIARLHAFNEKLGRNGLLVVMGVRLCHMLPFGLSNYLFGLTRITIADVAIGTVAGGLPAVLICAAVGVGKDLLTSGRFWGFLVAYNTLMLVPLVLRYLKPEWFRKIGVH